MEIVSGGASSYQYWGMRWYAATVKSLRANTFEIGFPDGWTDNSTIVLIGPERPGFAPNVQVHQEPVRDGGTMEQYLTLQRQQMQKELRNFRVVEVGDKLLGGATAVYHKYIWVTPQNVEIQQLQMMTQRSGTIYTLTASATLVDWPAFDAAFDLIVAKFKFS